MLAVFQFMNRMRKLQPIAKVSINFNSILLLHYECVDMYTVYHVEREQLFFYS